MTLVLELTPELERKLRQAAERQRLSVDEYARRVLEQQITPDKRRIELSKLLQEWIDSGDAEEQRETNEHLIRSLDEFRESERKLFPPETRGTVW